MECLRGDRELLTKPIKELKDKFELLPAFLKVRGLGRSFFFRLEFSNEGNNKLALLFRAFLCKRLRVCDE
jgi:hypothetical protein